MSVLGIQTSIRTDSNDSLLKRFPVNAWTVGSLSAPSFFAPSSLFVSKKRRRPLSGVARIPLASSTFQSVVSFVSEKVITFSSSLCQCLIASSHAFA